jgi:hypothetical protein
MTFLIDGNAGEASTIAVTVLPHGAFLLLWWYAKASLHCFGICSHFISLLLINFCSCIAAFSHIAVKSSDVSQG